MAADHDGPALDGRVIVITGASRGLGAGLAERFGARGAALGLCARSQPSTPHRAVCRSVDVVDAAAVTTFASEVVTELGPIDLWINNAGLLEPMKPLHDADLGAVANLLDVNVLGVFHGSQAFVRHRRDVGPGGILVNISSGAASSARAGWSAYGASKAAVDALTRAVALEEEDHGLRVHAIAPGVVDTDMQALIRDTDPADFPSVERFVEMKEQGTFNTPRFVADEIVRLTFGGEATGVVERVRNEWEVA